MKHDRAGRYLILFGMKRVLSTTSYIKHQSGFCKIYDVIFRRFFCVTYYKRQWKRISGGLTQPKRCCHSRSFLVQALVICEIFQAFLTFEQFLFQGVVNFPTIVVCKRMFLPKDTLRIQVFSPLHSWTFDWEFKAFRCYDNWWNMLHKELHLK